MGFADKLKFWKHEEEPKIPDFGELEPAFPTGGGPIYPSGIPETHHDEFGSLTPMQETMHPGAGMTPGMGMSPTSGQGQPQYQIVQPQPMYQPVQAPMSKDIEIISLKLDAIKNTLDTMNMRLERLEHIARGEEYPTRQGRF